MTRHWPVGGRNSKPSAVQGSQDHVVQVAYPGPDGLRVWRAGLCGPVVRSRALPADSRLRSQATMFHDLQYPAILAASPRAAWQIDDVIGPGAALDFTKPFMPEKLAQTDELMTLSKEERLTLN